MRTESDVPGNGNGAKKGISMREFRELLKEKMAMLKMDPSFARRYLNDGFSGGEKKRMEILQMAMLQPEIAVLDETDSGLDIDALRIVSEGVNELMSPNLGVLVITHYQRILDYIKPEHVHILVNGRLSCRAARSWPWSWRKGATTGCKREPSEEFHSPSAGCLKARFGPG